MRKIIDGFEYTKATYVVNNKEITCEQLLNVAKLNQLSEKQKESFFKWMESEGIYLISDERFLSNLGKVESEQEIKEREEREAKEERVLDVEERFLEFYKELRKNPELMDQYFKEIKRLETAIKRVAKKKRRPEEIISYAINDIRSYRNCYIRKHGRNCGTRKFADRKTICSWVYYFFTKDELLEVIQYCCEEKILTSYHWKLILLFFHYIAKIS